MEKVRAGVILRAILTSTVKKERYEVTVGFRRLKILLRSTTALEQQEGGVITDTPRGEVTDKSLISPVWSNGPDGFLGLDS